MAAMFSTDNPTFQDLAELCTMGGPDNPTYLRLAEGLVNGEPLDENLLSLLSESEQDCVRWLYLERDVRGSVDDTLERMKQYARTFDKFVKGMSLKISDLEQGNIGTTCDDVQKDATTTSKSSASLNKMNLF